MWVQISIVLIRNSLIVLRHLSCTTGGLNPQGHKQKRGVSRGIAVARLRVADERILLFGSL